MRQNTVLLCGVVDTPPKIVLNDKTGLYTYAMGRVITMRGSRFTGNNDRVKMDCPLIYSGNQSICAAMQDWKHGDLVLISGSIATKEINKTRVCKDCCNKIKTPGIMTYVNPIVCKTIDSCGDDESLIQEKLKQFREMSNYAVILGMVCRDPNFFKKGPTHISSYQMAIRRKFKIKEDDADKKVDFPWVKSYGDVGKNDAFAIKKGTYVLLDGFIQARTFKRKEVCPKCHGEYEWTDCSQEVVPYATEYLQNVVSEEDADNRANLVYEAIFGKTANEESFIDQDSVPENTDEIDQMLSQHDDVEGDGSDEGVKKISFSDLI